MWSEKAAAPSVVGRSCLRVSVEHQHLFLRLNTEGKRGGILPLPSRTRGMRASGMSNPYHNNRLDV
jgi:hypothetical protein